MVRIAIHNSYCGKNYAETELSRRITLAAKHIGWEGVELGTSEEINAYKPDFVIVLHFRAAKVTSYPTYGCFWHPTAFIETDQTFIRNVLSYDAYLSSFAAPDQWLKDRVYNTSKQYFIAPFFTSCNRTDYQEPALCSPRLAYIGTNWDGERFKDLFLGLEKQGYSEIYGRESGWDYLGSSYRGGLPFDGVSVLNVLNQAGVGLCLHRDEHTREGIPSMRIFEIAASGAIAICGEHPFIREQFNDTVLYLDGTLNTTAQIAQIKDYLDWIKTHPKQAQEMSREAHHIFTEKFSLERLLANLKSHHESLLKKKGFIQHYELKPAASVKTSSVQLIVRTGDRELFNLEKTLHSVQQQTYPNLSVLLLNSQKFGKPDQFLESESNQVPIKILTCETQKHQSNDLWYGLQSLSATYFGVLESGTIIHPNHIYSLVQLLDRFTNIGIAYSEIIQIRPEIFDVTEIQKGGEVVDRASLMPKPTLNLFRFLPFIQPISINGFLARATLVDEFMQQDPNLMMLEEIFLLLNLGIRGKSLFSYEATCQVTQTPSDYNRSDCSVEEESIQRIKSMLCDRELPTTSNFHHLFQETNSLLMQLGQVENQLQNTAIQLQQSRQRISAMETSKFWQLRKQWFQLKRYLRLNIDNE